MQRAWLVLLLFAASPVLAQNGSMIYENHNQAEPRPIRLDSVSGIARGPSGSPLPQVQIGLFSEPDHVQVAIVHTDRRGHFAFSSVTPGRYRVIAREGRFCTANIPVFVAPNGPGRPARTLEIHMVAGGIDTCSFGVAQ